MAVKSASVKAHDLVRVQNQQYSLDQRRCIGLAKQKCNVLRSINGLTPERHFLLGAVFVREEIYMNSKTKKITAVGMLCAITYVIVAVGRIPVVLFLRYDPSDVVVTLGGLIWGPMTACIVSVLVAVIEMITVSITAEV